MSEPATKPELAREIAVTSKECPVQIEGTMGGYPFFFRAKWNHWQFAIVEPGENPIRPADLFKLVFDRTRPYGIGNFGAGYMPLTLARQIVRRQLDRTEYLVRMRMERRANEKRPIALGRATGRTAKRHPRS